MAKNVPDQIGLDDIFKTIKQTKVQEMFEHHTH